MRIVALFVCTNTTCPVVIEVPVTSLSYGQAPPHAPTMACPACGCFGFAPVRQ